MPHVRTQPERSSPRVLVLAEEFLDAVGYEFIEQDFALFVEVFQKTTVLELRELWALVRRIKAGIARTDRQTRRVADR